MSCISYQQIDLKRYFTRIPMNFILIDLKNQSINKFFLFVSVCYVHKPYTT